MNKGRPRSITLYKVKNAYFVKYYDFNNDRRNKSTGESQESAAKVIKKELELLSVNPNYAVSQKAKDLYFGKDKKIPELKKISSKSVLNDLAIYQSEISRLTKEVLELRDYKQKYYDLLKLSHYRDLELSRDCPTFLEAIDQFEQYYKVDQVKAGNVKKYTASTFCNKIRMFYDFAGINDLYKITPAIVQDFIDYDFNKHPSRTRKSTTRSHLSRFFSWAGLKGWGLSNPIPYIEKQKSARKKVIKWFPSSVTQKVLSGLDDYYKPIFALMAFMGMNPNEIAGIRRDHLTKVKGVYEIYIVVWQDEEYKKGQKTSNRQSGLRVFDMITPLLDTFIKKGYAGKEIFFKAPGEKSAPRKKSKTPPEMWRPQQLSLEMNKLMPEDILVQDLRRCAANYMLKELALPIEKVAGILRNTPQTVWSSYAKFLPSEL